MKSRLIAMLVILCCVSACSPQASPTIQSTEPTLVLSTITPTVGLLTDTPNPPPTLTFTPVPTSTPELGFELPSDCFYYDPAIDRIYYQEFSHGACDEPVLSPDGLWIAYSVKIPATTSDRVRAEVRLFSVANAQSVPIYKSKCNIIQPEWTLNGFLVISDFPQDVGCGYTAIYDPVRSKILAVVDGAVYRQLDNNWSWDKNAFFTLAPSVFGPTCAETLSGFDFRTLKTIPKMDPITPGMNIYVIVGKPIWMPDNRTLLATIRDGVCSSEYDCSYGSSYILSISFTGSAPKVSRPFYDAAIDYLVMQTEEGKIELFSEEAKSVTCIDIDMQEARMP